MAGFVDEAARGAGRPRPARATTSASSAGSTLEELTDEVLDEAFDVNVKAAVMASQAAAPHMRRAAAGAIVNVASLGGCGPGRRTCRTARPRRR